MQSCKINIAYTPLPFISLLTWESLSIYIYIIYRSKIPWLILITACIRTFFITTWFICMAIMIIEKNDVVT